MILEKTKSTPYIYLSVKNCTFEIEGNSFSEDLDDIYTQVVKWVDKEMPKIKCEITCKLNLHVYNSITYKNLLLIMSKFHEHIQKGMSIKVIWFYDELDEDSISIGEDLKDIFDVPIKLQIISRND